MVAHIATELKTIVETKADAYLTLDPSTVQDKSSPSSWSIQEILGHLIDSAANNHQRFVRAQEDEALSFPKYEQNFWVTAQSYQASTWRDLVELWRFYNLHLAHIIAHIPEHKLGAECRIVPGEPVTLKFLVEDYLDHLKHHLAQIEGKRASS